MKSLTVIIPVYGAHTYEYAAAAVRSALDETRWLTPYIVVLDDGTPNWLQEFKRIDAALAKAPPERLHIVRYTENGGLTRSWNEGLKVARDRFKTDYACCANSDLIFTSSWDGALLDALDAGFSLVGPITNAPGAAVKQGVDYWWPGYKLRDDGAYLAGLSIDLYDEYGRSVPGQPPHTIESPINGFCLFAKTETWWANAYDAEHVFRPRNDFNSKGQPNPTPLMTLNEDELQQRWRDRGLKIGFCPASFVLHYRAVSRGDKYRKGMWLRRANVP